MNRTAASIQLSFVRVYTPSLMKTSIAYFIGQRYTRSVRQNRFISFISLTSMCGIALGVMVLLTVLSVMNGFQKEIRERMLSLTPSLLLVQTPPLSLEHWQTARASLPPLLKHYPMTPLVEGAVMFLNNGHMMTGLIKGIDPSTIDTVLPLSQYLLSGSLSTLQQTPYGMIMGVDLAQKLNVTVGDSITMMLPEAHVGLAGVLPRVKRVTVVGLFSVEYLYDSTLVFMNITDAATLIHHAPLIDGLQVQLPDPLSAPGFAKILQPHLPTGWYPVDWTQHNQTYFKAVQTEKTMMFLILMLLIAIAAFNLVSMLMMTVIDKTGDIALLRAIGAPRTLIMRIFIWQGLLIGMIGITLGMLLGYWLSHEVTTLVSSLEKLLHQHFLSGDVYFIDFLPSDFHWKDASQVFVSAFILCFLATLYPAWRAASILPAEGLRHE